MRCLLFFLTLVGLQAQAADLPLKILSLNLHGYHPKDEPERYWQGLDGTIQRTEPQLTSFTREEISRGHEKQMAQIESEFASLGPDLIFLQEVGAGLPETSKTCADFTNESGADALGKNTALKIRDRLRARGLPFESSLACRGNIGWQTDTNTFQHGRIVRKVGSSFETVFETGANPYPNGFIVEGTAILARKPWQFIDQQALRIPYGPKGENVFLSDRNAPSWKRSTLDSRREHSRRTRPRALRRSDRHPPVLSRLRFL